MRVRKRNESGSLTPLLYQSRTNNASLSVVAFSLHAEKGRAQDRKIFARKWEFIFAAVRTEHVQLFNFPFKDLTEAF